MRHTASGSIEREREREGGDREIERGRERETERERERDTEREREGDPANREVDCHTLCRHLHSIQAASAKT